MGLPQIIVGGHFQDTRIKQDLIDNPPFKKVK